MHDELQAFLEMPTARTYRKVRESLLEEWAAGSIPSPQTGDLVELVELCAEGEFPAVLTRSEDLAASWALSPRWHYLTANAADEIGQRDVAELERFTFQACLEGILATGDGSSQAPYLITYPSDEYDVALALGLEPRSQSLVERRGVLCDVLKCVDGEEVWFELTGVLSDSRQRRAEFARLQSLRM